MNKFRLVVALVLAVSVVTAVGAQEARAGVVIYHTGEAIFETGPLPEELGVEPGWVAGYKCSIFGLFWAYFHWWDCEPVAFQDDTYINPPEVVQVVLGLYSQSDMKMGFWTEYGRWILGLILVLAIVFGIMKKKDAPEDELSEEDGAIPVSQPEAPGGAARE